MASTIAATKLHTLARPSHQPHVLIQADLQTVGIGVSKMLTRTHLTYIYDAKGAQSGLATLKDQ